MENKKKIMFVCQYFYPEKISSGILPYEIATELSKKGYEVSALVGYPKEYYDGNIVAKKEVINDIKIKRIKYPQFNRQNKLGRILNYLSFCFIVLIHFMDFRNKDYCISYTNPPLLPCVIAFFSKIFHFKFLLEIYDLYPDAAIKAQVLHEESSITKFIDKANTFSYKNAWKIITLGNECKEYLVNHKKVDEKKVVVIPNWYKTQTIKQSKKNNKFTILYGGNMGIMQDMYSVLNLILDLKNHSSIDFILTGHGVKKEKIEKKINEYSIKNCKIYDFLPKEKYDELMNEADMAIVSLEDFAVGLGSPSKAYSYLSMGIPLIGILNEQMDLYKDIKEYKCGIVKNSTSNIPLSSIILDLANDKMLVKEMSNQAIKLFKEKYSLDVVKEQYFLLIND